MRYLLLLALITSNHILSAQSKWFTLYTDSVALVKDGKTITEKFIKDVKRIDPKIGLEVNTILNTSPYLIYFDVNVKTANLPLWTQVMEQQQQFFYEVAGGEDAGKKAFGYFFNGFYLPHELGHAMQHVVEGDVVGSYDNEYFANTVAILWWRKMGRKKELQLCYESAKMMWEKLPNPVPEGSTVQEYFSQNYEKASENPYVYGYMQFKQFMLIYEDKTLPDFDTFVKTFLSR